MGAAPAPPNDTDKYIRIINECNGALRVLEADEQTLRNDIGRPEGSETRQDTRCYAFRLHEVMSAMIAIERRRLDAIHELAMKDPNHDDPCPE